MNLEEIKKIKKIGLVVLALVFLAASFYLYTFIASRKDQGINQGTDQIHTLDSDADLKVKEKPSEDGGNFAPGTVSDYSFGTPTSKVSEKMENCLKSNDRKLLRYESPVGIDYKIAMIIAGRDEGACQTMGDKKDYCLSMYYRFVSILDKTKDYLQKISSSSGQNSSSFLQAIIDRDSSLCSQINQDDLLRNICLASSSSNISVCDGSWTQQNTQTLACKTSSDASTTSGCNVKGEKASGLCKDSYHTISAIMNRNIAECQDIDKTRSFSGYIMCQNLLSPDPQNVIFENYKNIECYSEFANRTAKENNDPSVCEKIPMKESFNKILYESCKAQF